MKITKKEYNLIIKEFIERLKDLITINGKEHFKKNLPLEKLKNIIDGNPNMEIDYGFTFIINDVRQILSRIRRK